MSIISPFRRAVVPATASTLSSGLPWDAGGGSAPWTPRHDSTAVHWWDARLGVTQSGGVVDAWAAQISGASATAALTVRPAYGSHASWGGRTVVDFDGANDVLSVTLGAAFATPCTIYLVCRSDVAETAFPFDLVGMSIYPSTTTFRASAGGSEISDGAWDTNVHKFCCVMNGASSALYVNDFVTAAVSGTLSADTGTTLTIGALNGPSFWYDGQIAALVFATGAHDAAKRALYASHFAAWGV